MLFIIHHTPVTAKGGCLWQQNNGNAKIRTPWWNISLMATPSVRRIQCEYCRKVIYTQTRNRKYCSFQTCGYKMLNLRKSLKKRVERGTYTCPCCGEQFLPIRADARYCSNACRQKGYRQRKTIAHTSLLGTWQSLSSSLSVLLLFSILALPILGSAKIP